jgi:hypothetical protein
MFARLLEMTIKPGTRLELINAIRDEVIPVFRTYKGFFDVIHLEVETDPTKVYAITLWHEDIEREKYTKQDFPKIEAIIGPFLGAPLIVKHCTVNEAISMKFVTSVAA